MRAAGVPSAGTVTEMTVWYWPAASKFPNSGARWFIVWWQFAHTTDFASWKSTRPPVVGEPTLSKGHTPL